MNEGAPLTREEMRMLFGHEQPAEVVRMLFDPAFEHFTMREFRAAVRQMAARQERERRAREFMRREAGYHVD